MHASSRQQIACRVRSGRWAILLEKRRPIHGSTQLGRPIHLVTGRYTEPCVNGLISRTWPHLTTFSFYSVYILITLSVFKLLTLATICLIQFLNNYHIFCYALNYH
jgi:hypothetical protein